MSHCQGGGRCLRAWAVLADQVSKAFLPFLLAVAALESMCSLGVGFFKLYFAQELEHRRLCFLQSSTVCYCVHCCPRLCAVSTLYEDAPASTPTHHSRAQGACGRPSPRQSSLTWDSNSCCAGCSASAKDARTTHHTADPYRQSLQPAHSQVLARCLVAWPRMPAFGVSRCSARHL